LTLHRVQHIVLHMPRKTVNLTEEEADRLASFFEGETPERSALARAVGEEAAPYSESSVLRQLTLLGMRYVQDELLREGYEALAAAETAEDPGGADAIWDMSVEAMGDD
jgi:hypothetical protein